MDTQVADTLTTTTLTAGTGYYQATFLPYATTYNRLACEVTIADAGQTCRIAVYTDVNGEPGVLVHDTGEKSVAAPKIVAGTGDIVIPTAGWYWTRISCSSAVAEFRAYAPGWTSPVLGAPIAAATLGTTTTAFTEAGAYGPAPPTAGTLTAIATAVPVVVLGIAAAAAAQSFVHVPRHFLRGG